MKRQGDTILDQPNAKKSDNVSTDLRSKIGAKLSTLLNRISSANAARSKRQLYEDLFRESTHSEIIIDPNIVVKIEESDSDDCTEDTTKFPAENFLTSAKSRITELLHKRQDSEKENSPSASGSAVASSLKSKTLQSISCNALNNRTKSSSNESSGSSGPEIFISQKQLKDVCVLVEDIVKSGSINSIHSLLNEQTRNKICSSSVQNFSSENRKSILNTQKHKNAKDKHITDKGVVSNRKSHFVDQHLDVLNKPSSSQSHSNSSVYNLEKSASKNDPQFDVPKSQISKCSDHPVTNDSELPNILDLGDILVDRDNAKLQFFTEDSEYVDDPLVVDGAVASEGDELESSCINSEFIQHDENPDTDVVLLCEKRPTYEVITLEEDDVIEDVHECSKCGKTFRAKSLLNFHLRMHGSNSNESPSGSEREMIPLE